jgi:cell division protein FtsI (penicillin-binding protein 3)/stage V sporulation protein D (sporulation-specific penicillin-binding protein)
VVVGAGVMVLRAGWVGVVRGGDLSAVAAEQQERTFDQPAQRGPVLDGNGAELAFDRLTATVTATPYLIGDPQEAARTLAPMLGIRPEELLPKLSGRGGYSLVAKDVDQSAARRIRNERIAGIDVTDAYTRTLPQGRSAAQLVGLVGEKGGIMGIEQQEDEALTGRPGRREVARDPFGRTLRTLHSKDPVPGGAVQLTVDADIQRDVQRILATARERYDAKAVSAVVMDPTDGAIVAMATAPTFDPNDRSSFDPDLARNRPVTDTFEPGSTFKLVTVAAALEEKKVTPSTSIYVPPMLQVYDLKLKDAHEHGGETWTVTEILERSSNIGTVRIAQMLGKDSAHTWMRRFGFGQKTGIDYPGEAAGDLPDVRDANRWTGVSIANIPIGQGLTSTQTQLARAYAVVANRGRLVTPHLVKRVGDRQIPHPVGDRVISTRTALQLDAMLRRVVSPQGTGEAARVDGYTVAGKTGTAEKVDEQTGTYSTSRYLASFVGYVPANRPRLVIAVSVDEPGDGNIFGGTVAAPVFEQIAAMSLLRLQIPPG